MAMRFDADAIHGRYREARQHRTSYEGLWSDVLALMMPGRRDVYNTLPPRLSTTEIYDDTAVMAVEECAARLQSGIMPPGVEWARLEMQDADEETKRRLAAVQRYIFERLAYSRFQAAVNETLLDATGFGNWLMRVGYQPDLPGGLLFEPIPMTAVWFASWHRPRPDAFYILERHRPGQLRLKYPRIALPSDLDETHPVEVIEFCELEPDGVQEVWHHGLLLVRGVSTGKAGDILWKREYRGEGSCPFVCGRWSVAAGDIYGIGPAIKALPSVRTLNAVVEKLLRGADIQISGLWQAEDDGVINFDTVSLVPGTILPVAPGSRGLQPIGHHVPVDLTQLVISDLKDSIRRALYNDSLGPRQGTPPTAFEVEERMLDLARQIGPAYERVWSEFCVPLMSRLRYLLVKAGMIQMPVIDGRKTRVEPTSALARSGAMALGKRQVQLAQTIGSLFGPQVLVTEIDPSRMTRELARLFDTGTSILVSPEEQRARGAMMGQMAAQLGGVQGGGAVAQAIMSAAGGGLGGGQPRAL